MLDPTAARTRWSLRLGIGCLLAVTSGTAQDRSKPIDPWGPWWLAESHRALDRDPELALVLARAAARRAWSPAAWSGLQAALDAHRPDAVHRVEDGAAAALTVGRAGLLVASQGGAAQYWPTETAAPHGPSLRLEGDRAWTSAALAPDGSRALLVAPGGWNGTELWDLTSRPARRIAVLVGAVRAVFDPRGEHVWAALRGGGIARFRAADGAEGETLAESFRCTDLAACPTGHIVGVGPTGWITRLPEGGVRLRAMTADAGRTPILAADPRGPFVAVRGPGGLQALVLDAARGTVRAECTPGAEPIRSLGFGPRGQWLWTLSGPPGARHRDRATFLDAGTGQRRAISERGAAAVAISFTGRVAIAGAEYRATERAPRGIAWLGELPESGGAGQLAITSRLRGPRAPMTAVAFLGTERIVTADRDGELRFWPWSRPRERRTLRGHHEAPVMLDFVADDRVVSGDLARTLMAFEHSGEPAGGWRPTELEEFDRDLLRIAALSPRESGGTARALAATESGRVVVYDLETGVAELEFEGHRDAVAALATRPDGLVASASMAGRIALWSANDGKARWLAREHRGPVFALAFDPAGRRLASVGHDLGVRVWDVASGQLLGTGHGHRGMLDQVVWSPDGRRLATVGADTVVRLWSVPPIGWLTDASARPLGGHVGGAAHCAFASADRLVTAAADGRLRIWDTVTGKLEATLDAHRPAADRRGSVRGLVANSNRLVSVGADGTLCVFDIERDWQPLARLDLGQPAVGLAVRGDAAAVGLRDGRIEVWPLDVRATADRVPVSVQPTQMSRFGFPTTEKR